MFRARPVGPVSEVDQDGWPVGVSRRQGRSQTAVGGEFTAGVGLRTRVIHLTASPAPIAPLRLPLSTGASPPSSTSPWAA